MSSSASEAYLNDNPEKRVENKENHGIVKATKAVPFIDNLRGGLSPAELRKARAKAQVDYRAALRKLNQQA